MKSTLLTLFLSLWYLLLTAQNNVSILSWNIANLGKTKDASEIKVITKILNNFDVIAIQEVVAKDPAGAKKVAEIVDNLNRMGNRWDYRVSSPTKSPSPYISERYAFIWKASMIELRTAPYLDNRLAEGIDREPYVAQFALKKTKESFFLVNTHIRPYNQQPELEIEYLKTYPIHLSTNRVVLVGDYNVNENHPVWQGLYQQGFEAALRNQPTTLKRKCKGDNYLNHPIDNIYYHPMALPCIDKGVIDHVIECDNLTLARGVSDHLPIYCVLEL